MLHKLVLTITFLDGILKSDLIIDNYFMNFRIVFLSPILSINLISYCKARWNIFIETAR